MNRLRYAFGQTLLSILGIGILSCSDQSISAPGLTKAPNLRLATHPGLHSAHYGGKLHQGKFVVCTNEAAPVSTATYSIVPLDVLPTDEYVTSVTLAPGECAVVFEGKRKPKKGESVPSILVTSDPASDSWGATIIDGTGVTSSYGSADCAPQTYVLRGNEGAIGTFNFLGPTGTHLTCTDSPTPFVAPYAGDLVTGQFKVCTGRAGPPAPTYTIANNNPVPGDRYVTSATVPPGTCKIVFETARTNGPVPSITVTAPEPTSESEESEGAAIWDGLSVFDPFIGFVAHDYFPPPGGFTAPPSYVLSGFAGAVIKFYFPICLTPTTEISPTCVVGGHGGTGTFTFTFD